MTTGVGHHRLSSDQLGEIAWGRAGPEVIRVLYAADDSRNRLLAAHALDRAGARDSRIVEALAVLREAQRRDEGEVAGLLRAGWFGPWVARLLDRPDDAGGAESRLIPLAAVAAVRTGVRTRLVVRVSGGRLHLPTMGALAVPSQAEVVLDVADALVAEVAGTRLRLPAERGPNWTPVREMSVAGLRLLVDDQHPDRDCFRKPLAEALSGAEFARWRDLFAESWTLLTRCVPELAEQVGQGLRVLVPLAPASNGDGASVSCVDSLGAFATTMPMNAADGAITLVHEWSHTLLNGVLGFGRLYDPESPELFFAPWRRDPRPLGGTLHGSFAFLTVAETWRALMAEETWHARAAAEFALCRLQVGEVLDALLRSAGLTEQGRRFVVMLRQRHRALLETYVRPEVAAEAVARLAVQKAAWVDQYGPRPTE
jgi:HEXXH motif-containing protein